MEYSESGGESGWSVRSNCATASAFLILINGILRIAGGRWMDGRCYYRIATIELARLFALVACQEVRPVVVVVLPTYHDVPSRWDVVVSDASTCRCNIKFHSNHTEHAANCQTSNVNQRPNCESSLQYQRYVYHSLILPTCNKM